MRLPMPFALLSAALLVSTAAPALAQSSPPLDDPNAIVEELVVTARYPGPAFWRVADADSEVWIMAAPYYIPEKMAWDKTRTEQVLKGANSLILPSGVSIGFGEAVRFAIKYRKQFTNEGNRTLDQILPTQVIERYEQLPKAYQTADLKTSTVRPIFAGLSVAARARKTARWIEPHSDIVTLAKKAKVKIRTASMTSALPIAKAIMTMPDAEQSQCFDGFIGSLDHGIKTVGPVAAAWAEGRTAEFLRGTTTTGADQCIYSIGEVKSLREKAYQSEIKLIKAALDQPGKTLMITNVRPLVAQNGILARLKAEGFT
ncbi:MAG: TraB/GumN family protein, partial [Caulobacteraceae bacterium]|nr:TraB/GumN family protein [Caulobacteraceae bacterium]